MSTSDLGIIRNRILSSLSPKDYGQLQPSLKRVHLAASEVLFAPGNAVRYVYFPNDAVVSLFFGIDGGRRVEVAMEGNEGAVGLAASLGELRSCTLSVVRDAGSALRLDANVMRQPDHPHLRLQRLLNRHVNALLIQIAQAGVCNRFHSVEARLARWLLMTQDRVGSPNLIATQKSIAHMLGVRRSSITAAARQFLRRKTINYSRGHIEVLDHSALAASACSCYDIIKRQYDAFPN